MRDEGKYVYTDCHDMHDDSLRAGLSARDRHELNTNKVVIDLALVTTGSD